MELWNISGANSIRPCFVLRFVTHVLCSHWRVPEEEWTGDECMSVMVSSNPELTHMAPALCRMACSAVRQRSGYEMRSFFFFLLSLFFHAVVVGKHCKLEQIVS